MTPSAWQRCGLVAAIGVFAMPIVIAINKLEVIRAALADKPSATWFTIALVVAAMTLQAICIVRLARPKPEAAEFARRVALFHGSMALAIFTASAFDKTLGGSTFFQAWFSGWFGPDLFRSVDPAHSNTYALLGLLPWLVLGQWACLKLANPRTTTREFWRGLAMACLATTALLGLWTFSPYLPGIGDQDGDHWRLFSDGYTTFFNLGVLLHLVAIWQVAVRSKVDWAWAGLVGFGCLISGLVLTRLSGGGMEALKIISSDSTGPALSESTARQIGQTLYIGWYQLSPYLAPIGYAVIAVASVVLFRTRPVQANAPQPTEPPDPIEGAHPARSSAVAPPGNPTSIPSARCLG